MKFNEGIYEEFKPVFSGRGFEQSKYFEYNGVLDYINDDEKSIHWVRMTFGVSKKGFVHVKGKVSFLDVTNILKQFVDVKSVFIEEVVSNYDLYKDKEEWTKIYKRLGGLPLATKSDIENFKHEIIDHVDTHILPFFKKMHDLQAVNEEVINNIPQTEYSNFIPGQTNFKVLIIMKICNNLKYEDYKNWALSAYKRGAEIDVNKYGKDYETLKSLVSYLDSGEYHDIITT